LKITDDTYEPGQEADGDQRFLAKHPAKAGPADLRGRELTVGDDGRGSGRAVDQRQLAEAVPGLEASLHSDSEYVVAGSFGWSDPHSDRREKMRR